MTKPKPKPLRRRKLRPSNKPAAVRQPQCAIGCATSLVAWGLLSLLGIYWHPLRANSAATILFAAAIGCFANWFRNRTFHCRITAWLFLAGGVIFLLTDSGVLRIEPRFVWPFIGVGTLLTFLLEWRYSRRVQAKHV